MLHGLEKLESEVAARAVMAGLGSGAGRGKLGRFATRFVRRSYVMALFFIWTALNVVKPFQQVYPLWNLEAY